VEELQPLLLDVWREACRHIEIEQSTAHIAQILTRRIPLDRVLIRRIDQARSCVETVATGIAGHGLAREYPRTECAPGELDRLVAWCRRGRIIRRPAGDDIRADLALLVPPSVEGDLVAGPLANEGGVWGVLVLVARPPYRFTSDDEPMIKALLEPFGVALDNEQRLRELNSLREAAEADKRSLLTRLGRQSLADEIVGAESGLRHVMELVEMVSRSDVPVLILGDTGTGKELVARTIHSRSTRASGPFLRVNCGAIPPELIDSELFGHERGSFTGAVGTRKGWFERADGGTLFLDEIGELPLAAQVRLLGVVQDGWCERVGGQRQIKVDVRIVAATHRDLTAMVRTGRFREDLWYRIAVFAIPLPPLRERLEDIPALACHFAKRAATRFGLLARMPSVADFNLLMSYPWPGNVRELAAVIDRAAILGTGQRLEVVKALGVSPGGLAALAEPAPSSSGDAEAGRATPPLNVVMRQHIEATLATTRGRIEGPYGAAAQLRINPHTLRARMRKLGIDWTKFRVHERPEGVLSQR